MFNKYYQDELSFLREMGREFAKRDPEAAPFLAERGSDPDVERLLEGFAFLSGRIRQKLDDEIPEITHALMEMLWPHYLRPIPSMAILQFEQLPQALKEPHTVPRGTAVDSVPVDGTACRFRTVYDVNLHPLILEGVELSTRTPPSLRLRFHLPEGMQLAKVSIPSVRLYLQGDPNVTRSLYLCLRRFVEGIVVRPRGGEGGKEIRLAPDAVRPVGFGSNEALLPVPHTTFEGFRLIQEYFAFPAKFLFLELTQLDRLAELGTSGAFDVTFKLRRLPGDMPDLSAAAILLNCTPIVNLFENDADPVRVDRTRTEYRIRPAGGNPLHHEIHSVDRVVGLVTGRATPREYQPFFRFAHSLSSAGDDEAFYRTRLESSVTGAGTDMWITFVTREGEDLSGLPDVETVSLDLLCTNRNLPSKLRLGDVKASTPSSPVFARFRNVTTCTPSVPPPLGKSIHWRLLSHLAINYRSLATVEGLRAALELYHFGALVDRQAEQSLRQIRSGIRSVQTEPTTRILEGLPVRGVAVRIEMDEDDFAGEGDLYLLATLLDEFFALHVTLNSFSQLSVKGLKHGEEYSWPPRLGGKTIL